MLSLLKTRHVTLKVLFRSFSTIRTPDLEVDNIVIGAGVVGLAIGEKLTRERPHETTIVVEKNKRIGEETSSRNSEVIHAGFYYPVDSLKTRLCIQGNRMLYDLFSHTPIPHRKVGKWVVAQTEEQHKYLKQIHEKATQLGVETYFIKQAQIEAQEPSIKGRSALVSPTTGIIDSHHFMAYLEQQIQNAGDVALCTAVRSIRPHLSGGYLLELATPADADETTSVLARRVFNAAGLHADKVSNMILPGRYKLYYARGHYFAYNAPLKVNHLIYPCPEKNLAGLGTHLTLDLAGNTKFGPDVMYIDNPYDYNVPEERKEQFLKAIQYYLPSVNKHKLHADYSGIRPKLAKPGEPFRDFVIKEETEDGYDNFFTLIGIESPGLTSSLAIAEHVHSMIK